MAIVFPNEAIARRWNGALRARVRRAPLEKFLGARGLVLAPAGVAQDSDNLVRATVAIVEAGLFLYIIDRPGGLATRQRVIVGQVACLVSRALAEQFSHAAAWRTVALVSTVRLLTPWIGLSAAALGSASLARNFQQSLLQGSSPADARVSQTASAAINRDSAEAMAEISTLIALRLRGQWARDSIGSREDRPAPLVCS